MFEPIKVFGLLKRRSDLSFEAYSRHWRTTHLAEALKLTGYIARYVQNHFDPTPLDGFARPFDGSPEIWFDDPAKSVAMGTSEEYLTGAYLDEPKFMEGRSQGISVTEEIVLPGPPMEWAPKSVKAMFFYRRAKGQTRQQFVEHWKATKDPLALNASTPLRFIRSLTLDAEDDIDLLYDAAEELWWQTEADFERDWSAAHLNRSLEQIVDIPASMAVRTRELRAIWPPPK